MEGVVKDVPVAKAVPPVEALNHEMVPAEAVAPRVSVPVPQMAAGVVEVIVGMALMLASTAERAEVQVPLEVST